MWLAPFDRDMINVLVLVPAISWLESTRYRFIRVVHWWKGFGNLVQSRRRSPWTQQQETGEYRYKMLKEIMGEQDTNMLLMMLGTCSQRQIFVKSSWLMGYYILDKETVLRFNAMILRKFKDLMTLMEAMEEKFELTKQYIVRTFGKS